MNTFTKKELLISYGGASIFGELYLPEALQAEKKAVGVMISLS